MKRGTLIPPAERLGLNREEAAEYVGVGATLFDEMVADGRMPKPRKANSRVLWSRFEIERAFAKLPQDGQAEGDADADVDPWAKTYA